MDRRQLDQRVTALSPEKQALLRQMLAARRQPSIRDISASQHGMWFFDQMIGPSPLYTIAWRCEVVGPLDLGALTEALRLVVDRHEALRSRFDTVDGKPSQIILESADVPLVFDDLSELGPVAARAEADRLVDSESRISLDIHKGPLMKVRLIRVEPQRHVFLLCVHHIVFDIVSTEVFFRDLSAFYGGLTGTGDPVDLPSPAQYGEFTARQAQSLQGRRLDELVGFWTAQLDGVPLLLDLPTDHPRPAAQSFRGAAHRFEVPEETTRAMCELAAKHRCTPFMVFMAAYHLLLSRFTGQADISVATPVANRAAGMENLIGLCLNMVVIRSDVAASATFAGLLHRIRETCLDVYEHPELPFDRLVEVLSPDRALSHNPLVQVNCSLNKPAADNTPLGDATITGLTGLHLGAAKFDLSFGAVLHEDHIAITVDYSADLFEPDTVADLAQTFTELLDRVCRQPDASLAQLPLTAYGSSAESGDAQDVPPDLAAAFLERAADTPTAVAAITADGRESTFAELDAAAAALAAGLADLGAGQETAVVVADTAGPGTIAAVLAVLRCGAGLVVAPSDAVAERIMEARSRLLVADAEIAAAAHAAVRTPLSALVHPVVPASRGLTSPPVDGAAMGAVVRTRGRARAVVLSRRALVRSVERLRRWLAPAPGDRVLVSEPLDSARGLAQLLAALTSGATACLTTDGADLREVAAAGITHVDLAPRLLRLIDDARPVVRALSGMEASQIGALPPVRGFGSTETGGYVAFAENGSGYRTAEGWAVYVLDDRLHPASRGSYGHVHLGGGASARSYLNDPAATAATWLPDPFTDRPGARMVRTGDIGRLRPDGSLELLVPEAYLTDPRVDPAGLEALLVEHPTVADAAVLTGGGRGVVAHLVAAAGHSEPLSLREIQAHLGERIARHLVPTAVMEHKVLPLTPDGRIDRAALRMAEAEPVRSSAALAEYVEPRTDVERVVVALLRSLLQVPRIGVADNIFDLGGHSILVVKLLAQISEVFDADLSLRNVFEAPTAAELAAQIESAIGADNAREAAEDALLVLGMASEEVQRTLESTEDAG